MSTDSTNPEPTNPEPTNPEPTSSDPTGLVIDDDAVLWSAGEAARVGRPLLVLMHGYGSNEADLFGLAPSLPLSPVIASIRAPHAAPWPLDGWSWFTAGTDKGPDATEVNASAD